MAEKNAPGETTLFIQKMDGELLGWDQPQLRLREALDSDDLVLWGQPVERLEQRSDAAGPFEMAEVLVRLREEGARLLPPGDFLPAFEHYGMMAELDRWVVGHALRRLSGGGGPRRISVNVSSQTLRQAGFAGFVAEQLRLAALKPSVLVLEIHEGDALDRPEEAARFAAELKAAGCGVLLDGFARRSVSFEQVRALRADYVKVDGTLVRNIRRSAGAAGKLKAILRAGASARVGVIAECAEDASILAALRMLDVGYAQGFGVGKPEPIENFFKS